MLTFFMFSFQLTMASVAVLANGASTAENHGRLLQSSKLQLKFTGCHQEEQCTLTNLAVNFKPRCKLHREQVRTAPGHSQL